MAQEKSLSLEELARRHNVVESPVAALDLDIGMVLHLEGKVRIVISVGFEHGESGPLVMVETIDGIKRLSSNAQLDVWHINGEPFNVGELPEYLGPFVPGAGGGNSPPPAQDAAGIVAVWRGPKKLN